MTAIGILGGTFDPIHKGHISIAELVLQHCKLSRVDFMPCFTPPHRDHPVASPIDRLNMVKLAIENHAHFSVYAYEMQQQKISYTIESVRQLRKQHPTQPFCFIIGGDAFSHFHEWHDWKKIAEMMHLIVVTRSEKIITTPEITALLAERQTKNSADLHNTVSGKIYYCDIKPIPISATHIRDEIKSGQKNIPELDEAVLKYIDEHKIYC